MNYSIKHIAEICQARVYGNSDFVIKHLLTDSRSLIYPKNSLFFAITGLHHDGHVFVDALYDVGVRAFVIQKPLDYYNEDAVYLLVNDVLDSLQKIMSFYRTEFNIPCVGVTGSNGKTIVKEWLSQILSGFIQVVRSPKSYNSQIGVPLSVSLLNHNADIAVFEAGISKPGEMEKLQRVINPTVGVFTSLGPAHQENFNNKNHKLIEKLKLFKEVEVLIYPADVPDFEECLAVACPDFEGELISWSFNQSAKVSCVSSLCEFGTAIHIEYCDDVYDFEIPFTDSASIENAVSSFLTACLFVENKQELGYMMKSIEPVAMRLEVREAINNCTLINDTYNSDINSFRIALDFAEKQNGSLVVVMSDIQSGEDDSLLYAELADLVAPLNIQFFGIGERISAYRELFPSGAKFYNSTRDFLDSHKWLDFKNQVVLLKGARKFRFEDISARLELKAHQTVLEVHMDAMRHNLDYFKSIISPATKLMVMVKAFSYGSGYVEIARFLQHQSVDYLGVAFADEGVDLRKAEISLPIIVMNPQFADYNQIVDYNLQMEVYSVSQLRELLAYLSSRALKHFPIHLKLDTGMHRLGIQESEVEECAEIIRSSNEVRLISVFSHFAASDMETEDEFTVQQMSVYNRMYNHFVVEGKDAPVRHIANTHGMLRHEASQLDMVRLGIGLYGHSVVCSDRLEKVSYLKTKVLSVKLVKAGDTIGYNRSGKIMSDSLIAIIPVGYADGLNRHLGNGNWRMRIGKYEYPTIGDVCMDMCMLNVSGSDVKVGDEVLVFGDDPTADEMAERLNTIVYEVLTGIPSRVKRIYIENS